MIVCIISCNSDLDHSKALGIGDGLAQSLPKFLLAGVLTHKKCIETCMGSGQPGEGRGGGHYYSVSLDTSTVISKYIGLNLLFHDHYWWLSTCLSLVHSLR